MKHYLFLMVLNFIVASLGALIISRMGYRLNLLDYPNERSSHSRPIPKAGAIGILVGFVITALVLKIAVYFWVTIVLFSLLGFTADRFELSSKLRLVIQIFCTLFFLTKFLKLNLNLQNVPVIFLIIYIVGTTNIYNFMDGINGIAAITGLVGFSLLALFLYQNGKMDSFFILSLCMTFSCIGFLPFNLPKAKVFMGDTGVTLLGSIFACLTVAVSNNVLDFICIASFLFPFYTDEIVTMYIRLRNRENLLQPHRKHFYQFLANTLLVPHWKISIAYGIIQAIIAIGIIILRPYGITVIFATLSVLFICIAFSVFLVYNKFSYLRPRKA